MDNKANKQIYINDKNIDIDTLQEGGIYTILAPSLDYSKYPFLVGAQEERLFTLVNIELLKNNPGWHQQIAIPAVGNKIYFRIKYNFIVTPWKQLATVDATLTWYDAVFQNGYSGNIQYAKDSMGNVLIDGNFSRSTEPQNGGEIIFNLPVGFRPDKIYGFVAVAVTGSSGSSYATTCGIMLNGIVRFTSGPLPSCYLANKSMQINAVFKAGS